AHRRARAGLTRTFQSTESFAPLTVRANLGAAAEAHRGRRAQREISQRVDAVLAALGLDAVADSFPPDLPYGTQKLVGLGMALIVEPSVVLLDEPAAGLDAASVAILKQRLRSLREQGLALLLVDHDMDVLFDVCDHVAVLDFGQIIAAGTPDMVRADERVRAAYLGEAAEAAVA
ncbi:MAG TPA: ATP-binding cassette domain-containing protein, partial [Ilumatobacteraceae bacterium]|nr:ATP-binding cassette domain-containing protein [Ilumatobacteraceae bacterium]